MSLCRDLGTSARPWPLSRRDSGADEALAAAVRLNWSEELELDSLAELTVLPVVSSRNLITGPLTVASAAAMPLLAYDLVATRKRSSLGYKHRSQGRTGLG